MTKHLVSMDPGLRFCWLSFFYEGQLKSTKKVSNPIGKARGPEAWISMGQACLDEIGGLQHAHMVVEIPQVYAQGKQKGDQDDITQLSGIVGAVVMALNPATVSHYYPREWKGQLPKETCGDRVLLTLSEGERFNVGQYGALQHNILDAIGIGLKHLGRFNVGAVGKTLTVGDILKRLEDRTNPKNVIFEHPGNKKEGPLARKDTFITWQVADPPERT